jgi:hypothetical protein
LINPVVVGDPIAMWQYTTTFTNTFNLIKLEQVHDVAYKSQNMVYFTNADSRTSPLFYDLTLKPVTVSGGIQLAPTNLYSWLRTGTDDVLLAVGDDLNELVVLDYYQVVGQALLYRGSFPLVSNGSSSAGRVIVLPNANIVSIDSLGWTRRTLTYDLDEAPQKMQGLFYDATTQDCNGYSNALFRVNSFTNVSEMVIVNGVADTPVLERYSFGVENAKATLLGSSELTGYSYHKLATELSANGQSVLVSGIKKTNVTLSNVLQIRSSANLKDVTFEKVYFDEMDVSDIQSFTLTQNNVFAAIVSTDENDTARHYTRLQNDPNSGGMVSTGDIGEVSVFAACSKCNFMAAVGTDATQIHLVNVNSGIEEKVIQAGCSVKLLSLNVDGTMVAFICTDTRLFVYSTQTAGLYPQTNTHDHVSKLKILSPTNLVLTEDGVNYNVKITTTFMEAEVALGLSFREEGPNGNTAEPVVNYDTQVYAYSGDASTVSINNFQGESTQTLSLDDGSTLVSMAFNPSGELVLLTDQNQLVTLTADPCPANSSQFNIDCICDPTFVQTGGSCQCSPFLHYQDGSCVCDEGSFFVSNQQCDDCSAFCSSCTAGGIGGCESYSALFIIMIIVIVLVVVAAGIFAFWYIKKRKAAKDHNESKESSDILGKEPLMEGKDDDKDDDKD